MVGRTISVVRISEIGHTLDEGEIDAEISKRVAASSAPVAGFSIVLTIAVCVRFTKHFLER